MNFKIKNIASLIILTIGIMLVSSCDTNKLKETPIDKFVGVWELQGRAMLDGIKIKIEKDEDDELIGKVVELNDNKYVQMFLEIDSKWITGIKRTSNFEFKLTEKKIGSELFSLYGLDTSKEFNVQFIDETTFGISTGSSDPKQSEIIYKKIEN